MGEIARLVENLEAEVRELRRRNVKLEYEVSDARAAIVTVREIVAAVPLHDTLRATRSGSTLVEYVKQAMQKAAAT